MELSKAFQIVYDLAEQNAFDLDEEEMEEVAKKQHEALDTFHDFMVLEIARIKEEKQVRKYRYGGEGT